MTAPSAVAVAVVARGCGGWGNCRRMMALPTVVVVVVAVIRRRRCRCNRSSALMHYQPLQHPNNSGGRRRSCRRHTRRVVHLVAFCGANRRGGVKSGHHSALLCCLRYTPFIQMLPTTAKWRKSESSFSALVTYRVCESIAVNLTTFLRVFLDSSSVDSSSFSPEKKNTPPLFGYLFLQNFLH